MTRLDLSFMVLGITLATASTSCTLDSTGTSLRHSGDGGPADGGAQTAGADGAAGHDAGHPDKPKPDAATADDASKPTGKDDAARPMPDAGGVEPDASADAGADASVTPPAPPPARLLPHLAGGSVGRSLHFTLYHSVGAPRVTGATVPRGMSSSAHYRLNSGLSAAAP